jgi:hypothetical protein
MAIITNKRKKETDVFTSYERKITSVEFINMFKERYPDDVKAIMEFYKNHNGDTDVDSCLNDYFRETYRKRPQYFSNLHELNLTPKINATTNCTDINNLKGIAYARNSPRNMNLRIASITALTKINTKESRNILEYMKSDPMRKVRKKAEKALKILAKANLD